MQPIPTRRHGFTRILGLDGNPLRRASDRAEAWIRIGLLAAFLVAGPLAAIVAGQWMYHSGVIHVRPRPRTRTMSGRACSQARLWVPLG